MSSRTRRAVGAMVAVGAFLVPAHTVPAQSFRAMGTLGGFSEALGVANNGFGAGTSENANFDTRAVLLNAAGLLDLGTLGGAWSEGGDLSADGLVVVGGSANAQNRMHAFRWTQGGGMQSLGTLGAGNSFATGVDAAGAVVCGWSNNTAGQMLAFRWTGTTGMTGLGTLGGDRSMALGVSGDGLVIVGSARNASNTTRAFRWTEAGGMQDLGTLGGATAIAEAANLDGSVIVGESVTAGGGRRAFRWTVAGMVNLGVLPGGFETTALDVSADGQRIVGEADDKSFNRAAVLWVGTGAPQNLNVLYGSILPPGWVLERATSISADGRYIAGVGTNPQGRMEGWVLDTIPAPGGAAALGLAGVIAMRRRTRPVRW